MKRIDTQDFEVAIGECYVLFPEPAVRLAKIQTKEATVREKYQGFLEKKTLEF